jgi:hypothetical protein
MLPNSSLLGRDAISALSIFYVPATTNLLNLNAVSAFRFRGKLNLPLRTLPKAEWKTLSTQFLVFAFSTSGTVLPVQSCFPLFGFRLIDQSPFRTVQAF